MTTRARIFAWVCFCAATLYAHAARAELEILESSAPPPRVTISVVGTADDVAALEVRLATWFRAQGTLTRSGQLSALDARTILLAAHEPGLRIWIALEAPALVRVFFAVEGEDSRSPRYLVREVPLDGGLDELGLEQVAQVVELSAVALWAGNVESSRHEIERELGVAVPEPSPRAKITAAASPATRQGERDGGVHVGAGFEYAARFTGPEGIAHGPGANSGLFWLQNASAYGVKLHAQLLLPRRVSRSGVALELRGASFALGGTFTWQASKRLLANAELGVGVDVVEYGAASFDDASLRATPARIESRPLTFFSAGVRERIGFFNVGVSAVLAVQLFHTHYDISDGERRSELLSPWLAQPGLALSATW